MLRDLIFLVLANAEAMEVSQGLTLPRSRDQKARATRKRGMAWQGRNEALTWKSPIPWCHVSLEHTLAGA